MAESYYSLLRSADAAVNYQKALALKPDFKKTGAFPSATVIPFARSAVAAESMQWLKNALALDPKNDTPLYLMGVAYDDVKAPNYPAAVEVLEKAASLNPNRKETFLLLSVAYMNLLPRKPTEALRRPAGRSSSHRTILTLFSMLGWRLLSGRCSNPPTTFSNRLSD